MTTDDNMENGDSSNGFTIISIPIYLLVIIVLSLIVIILLILFCWYKKYTDKVIRDKLATSSQSALERPSTDSKQKNIAMVMARVTSTSTNLIDENTMKDIVVNANMPDPHKSNVDGDGDPDEDVSLNSSTSSGTSSESSRLYDNVNNENIIDQQIMTPNYIEVAVNGTPQTPNHDFDGIYETASISPTGGNENENENNLNLKRIDSGENDHNNEQEQIAHDYNQQNKLEIDDNVNTITAKTGNLTQG
eukprot:541179_1